MPAVLSDETAARITRACLEGDGVASRLFELLWKRDLLSECSLSIRIPDTVIYRYNAPSVWYFTSVDGTIKRKTKAKLTSDHIMFEFTKRPSPSGIVAYFVSTTPEGDNANAQTAEVSYDAGVSTKTTVEYMDEPALKHFLTSRQRTRNDGILQRFIEPKSDFNNMLRAMWSPKVCVLERRVNRLKISDQRYDLYERAVTFEGPDFHSEMTPVRGPTLVSKVHEIAESIVQHVAAVTGDRIQVSRLALNFKVDNKDRMWLLFASSVRLHDELSRSLQMGKMSALTLTQKGLCNTPLEVNTVLGVPDHVRRAGTVQRSRPAKLQLNCKCPTCEEKVEEGSLCEIAYKVLVEYAERQRGSRSVLPATLDTNWQEVTALVAAQQMEDETGEIVDVPEMLQRLHPRLTPAEYARHRYDVAFLYKTTEVCSACFLKYSAPQLGVRPWRDMAADPNEVAPSAAARAAEVLAGVEEREKQEEEERVLDPEKLRTRRDETRRRIGEQRAAEEADEDEAWREKRREQLWRGKSCPNLYSQRGGYDAIRITPPAPILECRPPRPSGAAPLWTEMRLGLKEKHSPPLKDQLSMDPQRSHRKLPAMRGAPYLKELQKFAYNCADRAAEVLPSGYVDAMTAMNKGEGKRDNAAAPTDWLLRQPSLNRGEGTSQAEKTAKPAEREDADQHSTLASLVGRPLLLEGLQEEDEEVLNQDMEPLRASVANMWKKKWPNSRASSARASTTPTTRPPSRGETAQPSTQPSTRPSSRPASRLQSASGSSRVHLGSFAFSTASSQDNILRQSRPSSSPQLFAGIGERPPSQEQSLPVRRLPRPSSSPSLRLPSGSPRRRPGSSSSSSCAAQL